MCILRSSFCCNGRADCDDASDELASLCGEDKREAVVRKEDGRGEVTDPWWSAWDKAFLSPLGLD